MHSTLPLFFCRRRRRPHKKVSFSSSKRFFRGVFDARTNEMVVVVALASSSSSRSLLSSSKVVFQRRRRHHHKNRAHKIDRNSIASVSRSWTSRTSVSVPLRDLDPNEDTNKYSKSSFSEYISDGSRILAVTFPDETRREQMTDTTWKVQVLCV